MNVMLWIMPWYALTVILESPLVILGLSKDHSLAWRVFAAFWLTACTYPIVAIVLPSLIENRLLYMVVAETFAPLAEAALFWFAFDRFSSKRIVWRNASVIVLANAFSFVSGELLKYWCVN